MTCRRTNFCARTVSSICSIFSGFLLGPIIFGYEGPAAAAKSHIIYWNTSNPLVRFAELTYCHFMSVLQYYLAECSFQTADSRAYTYCQIPQETAPMQLLVDCFTKPPAYKLFLNLSHLIPQISRSKSQRLCHIYFIAMPEGETREMADSASDVRGNKITKSMKPLQPEADPTVKPRNQRFIGLLIAYVLITLLVVYMVVCAVCFQPRNCKPCFCRKPTALSSSNLSSRGAYCITYAPTTSQHSDARLRLPRSTGHFSRSIGSGERFLQETASLELLAPHALAARNDCGHPSPLAAWQARRGRSQSSLRPEEPPPPTPGASDRHGTSQKCFENASAVPPSSNLVSRVENRQTPVIFTKVAC